MATLAQIQAIIAFGPPFEIDGLVTNSTPVVDVDCLVITQAGPVLDGLPLGTTTRAVVPIASIEVFRGRNA